VCVGAVCSAVLQVRGGVICGACDVCLGKVAVDGGWGGGGNHTEGSGAQGSPVACGRQPGGSNLAVEAVGDAAVAGDGVTKVLQERESQGGWRGWVEGTRGVPVT
jgi:hypothetical protein